MKTNQTIFQMQCRKNWDAPGPDADADEKAADEDKMLRQVFATKKKWDAGRVAAAAAGAGAGVISIPPTISPLSQRHPHVLVTQSAKSAKDKQEKVAFGVNLFSSGIFTY